MIQIQMNVAKLENIHLRVELLLAQTHSYSRLARFALNLSELRREHNLSVYSLPGNIDSPGREAPPHKA